MKLLKKIWKPYCYLYWVFYRINIYFNRGTTWAEWSGEGIVSFLNVIIALPVINLAFLLLGVKLNKFQDLFITLVLVFAIIGLTGWILRNVADRIEEFERYSKTLVRKLDIVTVAVLLLAAMIMVQTRQYFFGKILE